MLGLGPDQSHTNRIVPHAGERPPQVLYATKKPSSPQLSVAQGLQGHWAGSRARYVDQLCLREPLPFEALARVPARGLLRVVSPIPEEPSVRRVPIRFQLGRCERAQRLVL